MIEVIYYLNQRLKDLLISWATETSTGACYGARTTIGSTTFDSL